MCLLLALPSPTVAGAAEKRRSREWHRDTLISPSDQSASHDCSRRSGCRFVSASTCDSASVSLFRHCIRRLAMGDEESMSTLSYNVLRV